MLIDDLKLDPLPFHLISCFFGKNGPSCDPSEYMYQNGWNVAETDHAFITHQYTEIATLVNSSLYAYMFNVSS